MKQALVNKLAQLVKHKKVGGLHFVRIGRLGCSFYMAKRTVL